MSLLVFMNHVLCLQAVNWKFAHLVVQVWRLITTFLFFGTLGFAFFFNMLFTVRYCRMLEEGSFRGRTADFFYMFLLGGSLIIVSFLCLVLELTLWRCNRTWPGNLRITLLNAHTKLSVMSRNALCCIKA